jgi:2-polyprenyl-6-methoxyphenol hydroxylase-like FAD-dependent oxidoreductase
MLVIGFGHTTLFFLTSSAQNTYPKQEIVMNPPPIKRDKLPVLIVGAGPTGLMMASQLARFYIPFRIVESSEGPTTQSRALVIQPRSLEIFEQMGLAEPAVKQGKIFQTINYVVNGKLAQRVPLGTFGEGLTQFPFLLILEQSKTEPLLGNFLQQRGHYVEWQTELVSIN